MGKVLLVYLLQLECTRYLKRTTCGNGTSATKRLFSGPARMMLSLPLVMLPILRDAHTRKSGTIKESTQKPLSTAFGFGLWQVSKSGYSSLGQQHGAIIRG